MSIITDNIEKILAERGMKKGEFYAATGITASAFSLWKLGQNNPSLDKLYVAADVLSVDISDIVSGKNAMSYGDTPLLETKKAATSGGDGLSEKHVLLIQLFDTLPSDRQDAVIRQLQEIVRLQKAQDDLLKF